MPEYNLAYIEECALILAKIHGHPRFQGSQPPQVGTKTADKEAVDRCYRRIMHNCMQYIESIQSFQSEYPGLYSVMRHATVDLDSCEIDHEITRVVKCIATRGDDYDMITHVMYHIDYLVQLFYAAKKICS